MFGVNCAPEIYNMVIHQALDGIEGVDHSIFDDIIVHGSSSEEHSRRLQLVLRHIQEKGLTLNIDKCQFSMTHIDFMGHILSEHGVGLAESKVDAVRNA